MSIHWLWHSRLQTHQLSLFILFLSHQQVGGFCFQRCAMPSQFLKNTLGRAERISLCTSRYGAKILYLQIQVLLKCPSFALRRTVRAVQPAEWEIDVTSSALALSGCYHHPIFTTPIKPIHYSVFQRLSDEAIQCSFKIQPCYWSHKRDFQDLQKLGKPDSQKAATFPYA